VTSGAHVLLESLKKEGVTVIFGYPGGAILPVYDVLYDDPDIRHILVRHEQGAAHAADGYARVSGRLGVCMATSGPGATNLVTGIATAYMDSSPVISIAGQVPLTLLGTDAFQEADVFSLMLPITKSNFLIRRVEDIPRVVKMAFEIASSGRQGPVHIDLPKNVQTSEAEFAYSNNNILNFDDSEPDPDSIRKAANMLVNAERPLIFAGGGTIISGAHDEVLELTELLAAPVVTTLMGKGVIPEVHPLCLGMVGMHGSKVANQAIQECDVLLGVGVRFDDRATGNVQQFAQNAKIIHVDIDPSELGKNVRVDLSIVADAKKALKKIINCLISFSKRYRKTNWEERLKELRSGCPENNFNAGTPIKPPYVIKTIMKVLEENDIVATEVGQCQMWAALYFKVRKPRTFITSGGLGTMGFGFPAAIGAKVACPNATVVDIAGDGSFLMNCNQLPTAVENNIPVIVVVFDNRYLGMVRQWQELFMKRRYSAVYLGESTDFVKLAEAFGAKGWCVERPSEMEPALKEAIKYGKTAVLDVKIDREMNVFPMVPPGSAIYEIIDEETVLT